MHAFCLVLFWTLCFASLAPADTRLAEEFRGKKEDAEAAREITNKQVLVDAFRNLVRYAVGKTNNQMLRASYATPDREFWRRLELKNKQDATKFGLDQETFSVSAMNESLRAALNAKAVGVQGPATVRMFLAKAHEAPVTFYFEWPGPGRKGRFSAAFLLSQRDKPSKDLEVRLLWLGLPGKVPISPTIGEINGMKPLKEAVTQNLKILPDGQLAPFAHPQ